MKRFKLMELINTVPGGKGDKTNPKDVNQKQLEIGIAVEREHTDSDDKAEEIALDHLTENPEYYTELVESGIVDEKEALEIYKKYFGNIKEVAVSKAQQAAAGIAYAAQKGDIPKSKLKGASKDMAKMDTKELRKFAKTKTSNLPKHVKEASDPLKGKEIIVNAGRYKNARGTITKSPAGGMNAVLAMMDDGKKIWVHRVDFKFANESYLTKDYLDKHKDQIRQGTEANDKIKMGSLVDKEQVKEEEPEPLTLEAKKCFLEDIKKLEELGQKLYSPVDLVELAEKLSGLGKMAERVTLEETEGWFDKVTINRNMKEVRRVSEDITKTATEAKSVQQRLTSLYEDLKHVLGRYFEISDLGASKAVVQDDQGDVYNQAGQNTSFDYLKSNFEDFQDAHEANKTRINRAKRNIS